MGEGKFEAGSPIEQPHRNLVEQENREWAEQKYLERCRNTMEELKAEGGRFRVERSQEVKPGIRKKEYDWKIALVQGDGVILEKPAEKPGQAAVKNVPLKEFIAWQREYLNEVDNLIENEALRRGITKSRGWDSSPAFQGLVDEIYRKNGVTPALHKMSNLATWIVNR